MELLVNIDVPDLEAALAVYRDAFDLRVGRRFGTAAVELLGAQAPIYLLKAPAGSLGAAAQARNYQRHWTPVHLDVVVPDLEAALAKAEKAGLRAETGIREASWGRICTLHDTWGHGWCLLQFVGRGYDEIAS